MKNDVILRTIFFFLLPVIFMFGWYVLIHGKVTPGGGFQGGAICASALILHALIYGAHETKRLISEKFLIATAALGAFIYAAFGFIPIFKDGNFLEYNVLHDDNYTAHFIGVMGVELGVHLCVFATLTLIFLRLYEE